MTQYATRRKRHEPLPIADRLLSRVAAGPQGCWIWTGGMNSAGYGYIGFTRRNEQPKFRNVVAHRVAYEAFVGPIPEGLVIDHACHTRDHACPGGRECLHRRCINPAHLEPVTSQENVRRSQTAPGGVFGRRTHCEQGHEFTPENTRWRRRRDNPEKAYRMCRQCIRIWKANYRASKAATS